MLVVATSCFAGVTISSPANGSTVGSPVHFTASASGYSAASMILYVDGSQKYTTYSGSLDTYVSLGTGSHYAQVNSWDNYGNLYTAKESFTVGSTSTSSGPGVYISSPANGATVSSPVQFVASASGYTAASMILYVDGSQKYITYSGSLNTSISLATGSHAVQVNSWDNYGNVYVAKESITVGSTSTSTSTSTSGTWVTLTAPSNGASVSSPVTVTANGGSQNGISGWVVYVDNNNAYQINNNSNSLSASVSMSSGTHSVYVRAWDKSNGTYGTSATISVSVGSSSSSSTSTSTVTAGTSIWNIQSQSGWGSCSACAGAGGNGPTASYSMSQWQSSPSLDGQSTKFSIWGGSSYANVLWYKSLTSQIGSPGSQHHFIYDTYFYVDHSSAVQALEFDINQFVNGHSLIFGHQCNVLNGNQWDVWDNQGNKWVHTGIYCGAPTAYTWHHVTIQAERATDGSDWLHYVSITYDGNTHYIDWWYPPTSSSWSGITVNFQMDGNYNEASYSTWLDKLTFSYW